MADRIPIKRAEEIAKAHGYDQVIIYARRVGEPGQEWVTTYGIDKTHCAAAARIGDAIGRQVVTPLAELTDRAEAAEREHTQAIVALLGKAARIRALEDRYEDWRSVSEPPHDIQIERGELLSFFRDDEDGIYWSGTWSERRDADIWCRIVTAGLNESANSILSSKAIDATKGRVDV